MPCIIVIIPSGVNYTSPDSRTIQSNSGYTEYRSVSFGSVFCREKVRLSEMPATDAIFRRTRYLGEYDFFVRVMYQYVRDRISLQLINIHITLNSD